MATKCIVIQSEEKNWGVKPIEFIFGIRVDGSSYLPNLKPKDYKYVELIGHDITIKKDIIFAYQDPHTRIGKIYLGYWNSGTV